MRAMHRWCELADTAPPLIREELLRLRSSVEHTQRRHPQAFSDALEQPWREHTPSEVVDFSYDAAKRMAPIIQSYLSAHSVQAPVIVMGTNQFWNAYSDARDSPTKSTAVGGFEASCSPPCMLHSGSGVRMLPCCALDEGDVRVQWGICSNCDRLGPLEDCTRCRCGSHMLCREGACVDGSDNACTEALGERAWALSALQNEPAWPFVSVCFRGMGQDVSVPVPVTSLAYDTTLLGRLPHTLLRGLTDDLAYSSCLSLPLFLSDVVRSFTRTAVTEQATQKRRRLRH